MQRALSLILRLLAIVTVILVVASALPTFADAGANCPTREQMIGAIAHKADVERGGRSASKWIIWQIGERESGLSHCWGNGLVKVSPTNDYGVLQLNPGGVARNCAVNPRCRDLSALTDPLLQVDILLNYFDLYGDLCPWNPAGDYMPGCGYR
jgi:hypothetical protein